MKWRRARSLLLIGGAVVALVLRRRKSEGIDDAL
jgi:hypothetical protein